MIRRREFITLLGGAAAMWPLAARAQQPAMAIVGFLSSRSANDSVPHVMAFRQGLKDAGYGEGDNAHIAFRWAEGDNKRLPALAADLVAQRVSVLVTTGGGPSALAAKAATTSIPTVFVFGGDPVKAGLVASFNRPGGNMTGVSFFSTGLGAKRLALLHQLVPDATTFALLLNPNNPEAAPQPTDFEQAARQLGRQFHILNGGSEVEIDAAFAALVQRRVNALVVGGDPYLTSRREQIIALAARHAVPTIYSVRECVVDGGLMSYGNSDTDAYRQAGSYAGRILKGAKPADLPIEQAIRFELVINLKTARTLGLVVPNSMQLLADEVIE
jgi:putative tryptophan/tyrosine transport system substrate-binding protein